MTNWYQVGSADGAAGAPQRNMDTAVEDCAKYNIPINTQSYFEGYRAGMKQYCSPTRAQGVADGKAGLPESNAMKRQEVCLKNGMQLNLSQYQGGYQQGLTQFCTFQTGYNIAASGHKAPQVCPAPLDQKFMQGWAQGRDSYCRDSANGFALGKAGKGFPQLCRAPGYSGFNNEFQRGKAIHHRIKDLNNQIKTIKSAISSNIWKYDFQKDGLGQYELGKNRSPEAMTALRKTNMAASRLARLKTQLFQARKSN